MKRVLSITSLSANCLILLCLAALSQETQPAAGAADRRASTRPATAQEDAFPFDIQLFDIRSGGAQHVADTLNAVFDIAVQHSPAVEGKTPWLRAVADVQRDVVIAQGDWESMRLAKVIVDRISQGPEWAQVSHIELYRLKHARSAAVAQAMRSLFDEKNFLSVIPPKDPNEALMDIGAINIVPYEDQNAVLIACSQRYAESVKAILEELDRPPTSQPTAANASPRRTGRPKRQVKP